MPFKPGKDWNGNANGRPKQPEIQELRDAMKAAQTNNAGKSILQHFVDSAYGDNKVLVALVKKILPDKTHLEAELSGEVTIMPTVKINGKDMEIKVGS